MAQKVIPELNAEDEILPATSFPLDDTIQSYKALMSVLSLFTGKVNPTLVTGDYTVQATDQLLLVDTTLGETDITLPDPDEVLKRVILLQKTDGSSSDANVSDGVFSWALSNEGETIVLIATDLGWRILNHYDPRGQFALGNDSDQFQTSDDSVWATASEVVVTCKTLRPIRLVLQGIGPNSDGSHINFSGFTDKWRFYDANNDIVICVGRHDSAGEVPHGPRAEFQPPAIGTYNFKFQIASGLTDCIHMQLAAIADTR